MASAVWHLKRASAPKSQKILLQDAKTVLPGKTSYCKPNQVALATSSRGILSNHFRPQLGFKDNPPAGLLAVRQSTRGALEQSICIVCLFLTFFCACKDSGQHSYSFGPSNSAWGQVIFVYVLFLKNYIYEYRMLQAPSRGTISLERTDMVDYLSISAEYTISSA